ncbi:MULTISPECIES: ADP-ribosyltransferase [unclassified Nonomuraea]|uniref:ADP-ribosyltransferase n=1 Tax=unclassified Nonomuraea TaxID=2593643 RepID=UPI0033C49888
MGFDGFLVPDWAKPFIGYAVGMDWPEGDEDGCFRLADACVSTAKGVLEARGVAVYSRLGDDWDGDALREFLKYVQEGPDQLLAELIRELVSAALHYNDLGVQVQYTKRMIEVSVWFLILQLIWLLAAAAGPWGPAAMAVAGSRIQLTRLVIRQLGTRLLINIGLFGGLMGGMDFGVQATQSRRDHVDWDQVMTSAGTGALLGFFLTGFTGILPARSMLGLMGRSGLASMATDGLTQFAGGQPFDLERLLKSFTSGVVGGADAHWASWSPGAHVKPDAGPPVDSAVNSTVNSAVKSGVDSGVGSGVKSGADSGSAATLPPEWMGGLYQSYEYQSPSSSHSSSSYNSSHASSLHDISSSSYTSSHYGDGSAGLPSGHFPENTTLAGAGAKQDLSFGSGHDFDALLNDARTGDGPATSHAGEGVLPAGAKPQGPFRILENPGKSGDGYVSGGQWGKYGAAGVLIRGIDQHGEPRYLLMQQSEFVSNAGRWQLPGGALDSLESPVHGAAREISEELGVNQAYLNELQLKGEHAVHVGDGGWTYTNLAADGPMFAPKLDTFEASGAKWFTLKELTSMANDDKLHPALAKALPDILGLYHQDAGPPKDHYTAPDTAGRIKPPVDFGAHSGDLPSSALAHGKGGAPPAYSGLVGDGSNPSLGQTIRRTESGLYYTAAAPHVPVDAPFGSRVVSPTFGQAVWSDVSAGLSQAERAAGQAYSGSGYIGMNDYLRNGDSSIEGRTAEEIAANKALLIEQIQALQGVMERRPVPETIDVFRTLQLTPNLFTVPVHELPGTVQRDPAFFSTNLGDKNVFPGDVRLRLRVPAGTPAFYLDLISHHRENELLLGTGVSWFAEDVQRKDGEWYVYAWVLPPESGG